MDNFITLPETRQQDADSPTSAYIAWVHSAISEQLLAFALYSATIEPESFQFSPLLSRFIDTR
jgi:hypothetical protein